jgi:hypothetical protein
MCAHVLCNQWIVMKIKRAAAAFDVDKVLRTLFETRVVVEETKKNIEIQFARDSDKHYIIILNIQ